METAVILVQCPDRRGIVARISAFVLEQGGNIIQADQYSSDPEGGRFFMRLEFCFHPGAGGRAALERDFAGLAAALGATWTIHYHGQRLRMGILVSRRDHCLLDVLYRWQSGELEVEPVCVVGNHPDLEPLAARHGIPFHHIPNSRETRADAEREVLARVAGTDFLVLARYMQILSGEFLAAYGRDVINIHHSFLPSFRGADPYRQARERGVKIIGATAHFVTEDLDEGPIIEQMVERVSHRDDVEALRRKGRILEQQALANALHAYAEHRVIRCKNQTIVFN